MSNNTLPAVALLIVGGAIAAMSALSATNTWKIISSPIRVGAALLANSANHQASSIRFVLHGRRIDQTVRTFIPSYEDKGDLLTVLESAVVWRPPYLFIRSECNNPQAGDCIREDAFEIAGGDAIPLGQLRGSDVAAVYQRGVIIDYWGGRNGTDYDWGLCMACLPYVKVVMTEVDRHLKVLPEQTWLANKVIWDSNEKKMTTALLQKNKDEIYNNLEYLQALIENAVIDKYCGQTAELTHLLARPHNDDLVEGLRTVPVLQPPSDSRRQLDAGWYE